MKKYIKPAIVKVEVENQAILAGSVDVDGTPIGGKDVGAKGMGGFDDWDEY